MPKPMTNGSLYTNAAAPLFQKYGESKRSAPFPRFSCPPPLLPFKEEGFSYSDGNVLAAFSSPFYSHTGVPCTSKTATWCQIPTSVSASGDIQTRAIDAKSNSERQAL